MFENGPPAPRILKTGAPLRPKSQIPESHPLGMGGKDS